MIQVKNLTFTYPKNLKPTIQGVDVSIDKGEIFGFLGPSGAGKSTLQKILIGVLKGYKGDVTVLHHNMKHTDTHFYNRLGVAFETPNFYQKFTAAENLQFFQSFYRKNRLDGQELMAKMGLSDAYHTRVSEFSKGMKMRLNLCRAFLHDPELIFLDEPTSGLDPVNVKKVKNFILEKKAQGKTIILNTHNMSVAEELCDRVAFIVNGSIKLIESPTVLKKQYSEKIVTVIYENEGVEIRKQFELKKLGQHTVFQNILKQDQIVKIETEEKTLEDIFIAFTGRNLQ